MRELKNDDYIGIFDDYAQKYDINNFKLWKKEHENDGKEKEGSNGGKTDKSDRLERIEKLAKAKKEKKDKKSKK